MYDRWVPTDGNSGANSTTVTSRDKNLIHGTKGPPSKFTKKGGSEFAFGVSKTGTQGTKDYQTAAWAAEELKRSHEKPFFLAVGFSKPHLPFFSPQEFWDRFPKDENYLPDIREDDFDDIKRSDGKLFQGPTNDYQWLKQNKLRNEAARAYLVCSSFADHCVGVVLDALETSPHAGNTIVVIWGDHGWHLGEKLRYRKATLWSESTRCPLMMRTPKMSQQITCRQPVNLIDLYPTLVDLCGLPEKASLQGRSIAPLLRDPSQSWSPTLTIAVFGNASVHDDHWNLIHRGKTGANELYDLRRDPMEWTNLYNDPKFATVRSRLESHLPKSFVKPITSSKSNKKVKHRDESIRSQRSERRLD